MQIKWKMIFLFAKEKIRFQPLILGFRQNDFWPSEKYEPSNPIRNEKQNSPLIFVQPFFWGGDLWWNCPILRKTQKKTMEEKRDSFIWAHNRRPVTSIIE